MKILNKIVVAVLTCGIFSVSHAQDLPIPNLTETLVYTLSPENTLQICISNSENNFCKSILIPEEAGNVEKVVPGDFFKGAKASWLALSKEVSSLCVLFDSENF